jgi:acyl carrier protein
MDHMTELEQECIRRIAEAKSLPEESLTLDTTLESIEVDSLDRVSLSFDLEDRYDVQIREARLHAIRTIRDVTEAMQEAILEKHAAARSNEGTT